MIPVATNKNGSSLRSCRSFGSPKPVVRTKLVSVVPSTYRHSDCHVSVAKSLLPDDIDIKTKDNELFATEYVQEMYDLFFENESCVEPYLHKQPDILNEGTRGYIVDATMQIHSFLKLSTESLYLAVDILDRFLSRAFITSGAECSVVCLSCLLIASKYEDVYPPSVDELANSFDFDITPGSILDMETKILRALDYRISNPTPLTFLIRFSQAAHADKRMSQMSHFFLEGTLLSYSLLCKYKPSELAAASVFLARRYSKGRSNWSATLDKYTRYEEEQITPVARAIMKAQSTRRSRKEFRAVDKKYTTTLFGGVALTYFPCDF